MARPGKICRSIIFRVVFLSLTLVMHVSAWANSDINHNDLSWLTDNTRFALDVSTQAIHRSGDTTSRTAYNQQLGYDLHKVFSTFNKDLATVVSQVYMSRIDNLNPHPPFYDDGDDWEMIYKINTINITAFNKGKLNLLLGHAELPYGLEYSIDTNNTLRTVPSAKNIGLKVDWGVGLNGYANGIKYDVFLSRGSGVKYKTNESPYAISGRIGTAFGSQSQLPSRGYGLSFFHGEILTSNNTSKRTRIGLDYQNIYGPFGALVEFSLGLNEDKGAGDLFTEINWTSPNETFFSYLQLNSQHREGDSDWDNNLNISVGMDMFHYAGLSLGLKYSKDLSAINNSVKSNVFEFQLRYRL